MNNTIVSDVWNWEMPLVLAVKPHELGEDVWLENWPLAHASPGHFIAIRGYSGTWGTNAYVYYADSSANGGYDAARYDVPGSTAWRVNDLNHNTIVW